MKRFFILSVSLILLSNTVFVYAGPVLRRERAAKQQSTCVYKYLACKDDCDYRQDPSEVNPCKAACDRKYPCRPPKVKTNMGDNQGE